MSEDTSSGNSFALLNLSDSTETPTSTMKDFDSSSDNKHAKPQATSAPPTLETLSKMFALRKQTDGMRPFKNKDYLPEDILFTYSSNSPEPPSYSASRWIACLHVYTPHVIRLLREGFFWSAANIVREHNAVAFDCSRFMLPQNRDLPWDPFDMRRYLLTDQPNKEGQEPLWTACLQVFVGRKSTSDLSKFRPSILTRDKIIQCVALVEQQIVYCYAPRTERNISAIFEDMPLEGEWPWPKKEDQMEDEKNYTDRKEEDPVPERDAENWLKNLLFGEESGVKLH